MRRRLPDIFIIALLFLLPLVMFWMQTVGGRTLIPAENLYQYEPYASYRDEAGAPAIPHNHLVSDLVLQNYPFKQFIRENLAAGEFPLWNPHQFGGIPFFAAGQQSTLYPLNVIFYALDLPAAYGWFTVAQLWLAGASMFAFMRGLGVGRFGGAISGVTYQLSAFFVISAVFPMIIAGAAWLPLILLMVEHIIRAQPLRGRDATPLWVALGAAALGCVVLAGHVEITYYTLLIAGFYAAGRLIVTLNQAHPPTRSPLRREGESDAQGDADVGTRRAVSAEQTNDSVGTRYSASVQEPPAIMRTRRSASLRYAVGRGVWLLAMVALGMAIGAVQFIPTLEAAGDNFRVGSASLEEVYGWAHPPRDVVQFLLPNFYGNPAHHTVYNWPTGQTEAVSVNTLGERITHPEWGIKNYVEGALYVGILPLALAGYAVVSAWRRRKVTPMQAAYVAIFAVLGVLALTFMFGLPTYALLYYALPGIDQLHSPFRWVFALTLCVAALAGMGAEYLTSPPRPLSVYKEGESESQDDAVVGTRRAVSQHTVLIAIGGVVLAGLVLSRLLYAQVLPLVERAFTALAGAERAFADAAQFYNYQFTNMLVFGAVMLAAGLVVWGLRHGGGGTRRAVSSFALSPLIPQTAAIALIAVDLMIASWGFNPASDPALLEYTPPALEWLQAQEGNWRYTTLDTPGRAVLLNANSGMHYGLDDVRGYESIIPAQYVRFMESIAPQPQLDFNRVAPLFTTDDYNLILTDARWDALNVRYLVTYADQDVNANGWALVYDDRAVRIYENAWAFEALLALPDDIFANIETTREQVTITPVSDREMLIEAQIEAADTDLLVSQNYNEGWRAYIRPQGAGERDETALPLYTVDSNFIGLRFPEAGAWTVRLVYSPTSFQIGAFASFIGAALALLLVGIWAWHAFVGVPQSEGGTAARVAKNSVAPIILNLFNRGIDFAFAAVMLRLLGPELNGLYYYAVILFGWFDIFTNFGLNLFVMREVARDKLAARKLFINTSALRLVLALLGVPLLLVFLTVRQSTGGEPLPDIAILAILLLYVGLIPNSLSTGLTALYYAFERAEIPAAVATIATIAKAVFGVGVLLAGWGILGIAAASIVTNVITLAVLAWGARGLTSPPAPLSVYREGESEAVTRRAVSSSRAVSPLSLLDFALIRSMIGQSYPLMLNHFLATIFFKIDVILIEAIHTATMVGQYSVAYKWVEALNIIPSFFTQALLPIMSRQAHEDRAAFGRSYQLALKLLLAVALPMAIAITFAAVSLVNLLGGAEYLPDGAIALQLMIWSIPIGWMNSLTQYALIALDLQRQIMWAFVAGVGFNIITNLIFIPTYGYRAAALTTIASEAVLFVGFILLMRRGGVTLDWLGVIARPLAAGAAMLAVLWLGWSILPIGALALGGMVYAVVLLALRPFSADEWARLLPLLPGRVQTLLQRAA
jgi:O-antigen/teichoic acid export membrane protein